MKTKLISLILAMFMLQPGCAVWRPLPFAGAEPRPLPGIYEGRYDYPEGEYTAEIIEVQKESYYTRTRVEIPLHQPEGLFSRSVKELRAEVAAIEKTDQKTARDWMLNYTNRIDLYVPKDMKPGEKRPVILISPILGGNMVVDLFAEYYAGRGYIAALVHRKRLKWDEKDDEDQIERYLRLSIMRLRQTIDWLELQPEVDAGRIGGFGVSYGAILHTVLAAVEPRVKYHVLAMPGGPIPDVMIDCPEKSIQKVFRKMNEIYGWDKEKIYEVLKGNIVTDPFYLAPYVPRDKVQVYVALFDRVVGVTHSFGLWKEMGKPSLKVMPFGHYGGVLIFPYLQSRSYMSFKKRL